MAISCQNNPQMRYFSENLRFEKTVVAKISFSSFIKGQYMELF